MPTEQSELLPVTALVVAKAPVPGLAKTRLAASIGDQAAADIAAAALLDTLDAVLDAPVQARVVAMTGDLDSASHGDEIRSRLQGFTVIEQRGEDFAERLVHAHADAYAACDFPIVQIGMDTPQVTGDLLAQCACALLESDAVLGMARDGGWWVLGVTAGRHADCLREVPMSQSDTGAMTLKALRDSGLEVALVTELVDLDTIEDVEVVRNACAPTSQLSHSTHAAGV